MCCSVLQCVAVCYSALQSGFAIGGRLTWCVESCCSVLQCVAACCSVLLNIVVGAVMLKKKVEKKKIS